MAISSCDVPQGAGWPKCDLEASTALEPVPGDSVLDPIRGHPCSRRLQPARYRGTCPGACLPRCRRGRRRRAPSCRSDGRACPRSCRRRRGRCDCERWILPRLRSPDARGDAVSMEEQHFRLRAGASGARPDGGGKVGGGGLVQYHPILRNAERGSGDVTGRRELGHPCCAMLERWLLRGYGSRRPGRAW